MYSIWLKHTAKLAG